jgi:carboxyl-terminal processing protease
VSKLFNSNSSREFILEYTNKNKDKFTAMSLEEYYQDFEVSDRMLKDLVAVGEKNMITFDPEDFNESIDYLKILVKAHLGRQIYDDDAFYMVINDINEVYQQAIKLFDEAERIAMATDLSEMAEEE